MIFPRFWSEKMDDLQPWPDHGYGWAHLHLDGRQGHGRFKVHHGISDLHLHESRNQLLHGH